MRIDNPSIITNDGELNTGLRRNITKVTQSGWSEALLIADGRLYAFKGGHGNVNYTASMASTGYAPNTFRRGIDQMWEIVFPTTETGNIVDVDTYGQSAWALFDSGNLYTWGRNVDGQLGVGDTTDRYVPTLSATSVSKVYSHHSQDQRSARYQRLFHLKTNGKLFGCGYNNWNQIGDGTNVTRNSWVEITAAGLNPKSVWNLGSYTGCLIVQKSDNTILICGYNGYGQLGNNTTNTITSLTNLSTAWNGGDNTMVIKDVWFMNFYYDGANSVENTALGMLLDNGTTSRIVGCGNNSYGELGDSTTTNRTTPVVPTVLNGRVKKVIKTGDFLANIFVLKTDGTLWDWGYNGTGQLGRGDTSVKSIPAQVMTGVEMIYDHMIAGADFAYRSQSAVVKKLDGTYWMAGYNSFGQLANGNYTNQSTFTQMLFPRGIQIKHFGGLNSTSHGDMHFIVTENNEIYAYGYNQLYAISVTSADDYALPLLVQPPVLLR